MNHRAYLQKDCGASADTLAGAYLRSREAFWEADASKGKEHVSRRNQVAEVMRRRYERLGLVPPENLARLASGAPSWAAGHQLIAVGGPAFFHYKILSMLRRSHQHPEAPVPVFWLASEDHDWDEVRSFPFGAKGSTGVAWEADAGRGAVGRIKLDQSARSAVESWAEAANLEESWKDELVEAYGSSESLADAVFKCVHQWFGEDGLLVLDADDPELKLLAAPLWEAELAGKGIGTAVERRTQWLKEAGWSPPLHPRGVSLFEIRTESRVRLEQKEEGVAPIDGSWSIPASDAAKEARKEAQRWSPNAALRPIYQEFLLGNHAVFLGPSELAYWLQLSEAFVATGVPRPTLELRDGALALDRSQSDWLDHVNWHPREGLAGVEKRWNEQVALGASQFLPSWDFIDWSDELATLASQCDVTLEGAARAAVKKMQKAYDAHAAKIRRAWKLQHQEEHQFMEALSERIAPHGTPQERAVHIAFIAQELGGWKAFKGKWMSVTEDHPVFIVFAGSGADEVR